MSIAITMVTLKEGGIPPSASTFAQESSKRSQRRLKTSPLQPNPPTLFSPVLSGFLKTQEQVYLIQPLGRSDDGEHAVFRQEQLKVVGSPGSSALGTSYDGDRGLFRSRSRPRVGV